MFTEVPHGSGTRADDQRKSFDHLVGGGEQRRGHLNAERLGGLKFDYQFELGRRLHQGAGLEWSSGRLASLFTDELLRRAAQAALGAEIRRGSGLRSRDETAVVHAAHSRGVATDLAGRGCLVDRRWTNGRRSNSLTRLSQL
jgi:hypothetical protein